MFQDFEAVKTVGLFALFIVLVIACFVVAISDAKRRRIEHDARVKRQVEALKRARVEAERRRQAEAQAAAQSRDSGAFRPSEVLISAPPQPPSADPSSSGSQRQVSDFGTSSAA